MSAPRLSLAQQIALLEDTAPKDFDPEEPHANDGQQDDEDPADNDVAARAHYVDVGPSTLRKLHDSIADPKYDGKRTTRKQLLESDAELGSDEEDEDEDEDENIEEDEHSPTIDDELPSESEASDAPEPPKAPSHHSESEPPDDLSSTLRKTRDEDRTKGKAVSRQIAIWDTLLDARIRMQKSVTAANRLPVPSDIPRFSQSATGTVAVQKLLEEALSLSDELFELQEALLTANEGVTPPPRKRRRIASPPPSSPLSTYAEDVKIATADASALAATLHPHLLTTLTKWSAKIQAVAPSVLLPSSRGAFSNRGAQGVKSAVALVEETLAPADYSRVLTRTRMRRTKGARVGQADEAEGAEEKEDPDVFDDTDFYQQLLRDVIDSRSGSGAGAGAEDWMALQKQKKAKKRVDTKASKGRKLRYEVHEKLQNYMVPVPAAHGWHEEQIDELFSSLLGRGFEDVAPASTQGEGLDMESKLINADILKGFRVFG